MSTRIVDGVAVSTPSTLERAGYRIEYGSSADGCESPELVGRYWWTWSEGSGLDVSDGDWATNAEAVADAFLDRDGEAPARDRVNHDVTITDALCELILKVEREHCDDTPCIEDGRDNCNDSGTGEGQFHGRM